MLDNLKSYLESIKITPISWLTGVSGVLMVRFFLESFSSPNSIGFFASDAPTLIHYYLFFLSVALVFMVLLYFFVPNWRQAIPQLTAISMAAIFIAPILDWVMSRGYGVTMAYLFDSPKEMLSSFFAFFSENLNTGITLGLRVEVALMLVLFCSFVYFAQKNWQRAIISAVSLYVLIFIFLSLPGIINIIGGQNEAGNYFNQPLFFIQKTIENSATVSNNLHNSLHYGSVARLFEISFNFIMGKILFLVLATAVCIWFHINFREKFRAMFKNSRPERVTHYILMIFLGIFVSFSVFPLVKFNWNDWLSVITLCLSLYLSIMFAVCVNDIVDENIDTISNTDRPLISNSLSKEDMKQSAFMFLTASLVSAFLAGYTAFFFILSFTALYYIYSSPPTRFKLVPFFSSFLISLCCLTAVLAGFFLASPVKYVSAFPPKLALAVVVIFFLGSHIRDIKDVEGDKAAGIKTVPVLFGDIWGPKVVGIFASFAFLLVPIFLKTYILFAPAIPSAVLAYYLVNKKPYTEKYIFITYFVFAFVSFLLLFV